MYFCFVASLVLDYFSHTDPASLFPELSDALCECELCQAPALEGGEPHQRGALRANSMPPCQLWHRRRDERSWSVTVRLTADAERRPRFACSHVVTWSRLHTFHITGDFHSALVWQSQHLHTRQAPRGRLPDGCGDAASYSDILGVDSDIAVHDVGTGPNTCKKWANQSRKDTPTLLDLCGFLCEVQYKKKKLHWFNTVVLKHCYTHNRQL